MALPGSTTDYQSALSATSTPVFSDNVQDLLGVGTLAKHPSTIITVNSIADVVDGHDGVTTLREAINQASADNGEDLIVFERSLFSTAQTMTLGLGELDITHNISIITPRDTLTGGDLVTVSGNKATRVFEIEQGATVSLNGLIIANGQVIGDDGGGIKNSGILSLDNTIVRNASAIGLYPNNTGGNGGGIYNNTAATIEVSNSNIQGSAYNNGGSIYNAQGATVLWKSITSNGYNLIGDATGSTGFDATGDLVGTSDNPIDPRLAPLDFYGGDTLSLTLLPGSPAIDAGDPTVLDTDPTTDQRGFPRVRNGRADIGAFEFW